MGHPALTLAPSSIASSTPSASPLRAADSSFTCSRVHIKKWSNYLTTQNWSKDCPGSRLRAAGSSFTCSRLHSDHSKMVAHQL